MVLLAGGELDLGDGGDAPRVFHLPRRLLDTVAQRRALAVQPCDLKIQDYSADSLSTITKSAVQLQENNSLSLSASYNMSTL